jgi:hypothetical protein
MTMRHNFLSMLCFACQARFSGLASASRILIVLFILGNLLASCNRETHKQATPEEIVKAYEKVKDLYRQIGYSEADTINKIYDLLDKIVTHYELKLNKPDNFELMKLSREDLFQCLVSFNEFHEELYTLEDELLILENQFRKNTKSALVLESDLAHELIMLDNVALRIKLIREKAIATIKLLNETGKDWKNNLPGHE